MILYDLVANTTYLSEWISINAIFGENQKAWREKLIASLKNLEDEGVYGRSISFTDSYAKFKIYKIDGFKEMFNPLVYKQSNIENSLKTENNE
jgi:hypothetical protein